MKQTNFEMPENRNELTLASPSCGRQYKAFGTQTFETAWSVAACAQGTNFWLFHTLINVCKKSNSRDEK